MREHWKKNVSHMNTGYVSNIWCSVVQHIFLFPYILQLLPSRQLCMPWWWHTLTIHIGSCNLHSRHIRHLVWQKKVHSKKKKKILCIGVYMFGLVATEQCRRLVHKQQAYLYKLPFSTDKLDRMFFVFIPWLCRSWISMSKSSPFYCQILFSLKL